MLLADVAGWAQRGLPLLFVSVKPMMSPACTLSGGLIDAPLATAGAAAGRTNPALPIPTMRPFEPLGRSTTNRNDARVALGSNALVENDVIWPEVGATYEVLVDVFCPLVVLSLQPGAVGVNAEPRVRADADATGMSATAAAQPIARAVFADRRLENFAS